MPQLPQAPPVLQNCQYDPREIKFYPPRTATPSRGFGRTEKTFPSYLGDGGSLTTPSAGWQWSQWSVRYLKFFSLSIFFRSCWES
jgi:hypothetical protein